VKKKNSKQVHFQKTEAILYKYPFICKGLESMMEELRAEESNNGVGSVDPSKEVFITNKFHSVTESAALTNITSNKIRVLKNKIKLNKAMINRIDSILSILKEEEEQIIKKYYLEGKQWHIVSSETRYSVKWCFEIRKRAIEKISLALGYSIAKECKELKQKEL
jgi:hypothetical protein